MDTVKKPSELECIWQTVCSEQTRAQQWMTHDGVGICCNFIQVDTTVIMTLTVMSNRKKQLALSRPHFASLMGQMESWLNECRELNERDCPAELYKWSYHNIRVHSGHAWEKRLGCHRVFLFPLSHVEEVKSRLFTVQNLDILHDYCGVSSVCAVTTTDKVHSRVLYWGTHQDFRTEHY